MGQKKVAEAEARKAEVRMIGDRIAELDRVSAEAETQRDALMAMIPNLPHASVALGREAADNPEIRVHGSPRGFEFKPLTGIPVAHPDIRVWEVTRAGKHVGLWYFDPYARQGKRSGAWMNAYRSQEKFRGKVTTIVSNNSNFIKGKPGEPVTMSWDDAETMFHEFGHALHGLNSDVTYPSLSGTAVARDYVEFPSQLNEHWLTTPQVINTYAVNSAGQPIPQALVDKIKATSTFNQGFITEIGRAHV